MKRTMKAGLMIALIASASATLAGARSQVEVFVDKPGRYAEGTLVDARGSSDTRQRIGCFTYSGNFGACIATDSNGNTGSCHTSDPSMVQSMQNLSSDSYLLIVWDASNVCTMVYTDKSSMYRPGNISGF